MKSKILNKKIIYFLPIVVFMLLIVFFWRNLTKDSRYIPSTMIGKAVSPAMIAYDFNSPITLLNVFATWCYSCQLEQNFLLQLSQQKNINIIGLNYKDNPNQVTRWLSQYGNPYKKIIYDTSGQLGIDLGVYGTPETFLIDKNAIIRYKIIGPLTPNQWQHILLPLIHQITAERYHNVKITAKNYFITNKEINYAVVMQSKRFKQLVQKFRCLVCQNESLADSNASLAQDLRNRIAEMIQHGDSNQLIQRYLVSRYGQFILFNPPFDAETWVLWLSPFFLLSIGLFFLLRRTSR